MVFRPDTYFFIHAVYVGVVYFLGLHPRLVEWPLQGQGLILSGLKGRFYKPRSTAWGMVAFYPALPLD